MKGPTRWRPEGLRYINGPSGAEPLAELVQLLLQLALDSVADTAH